MQHSPTQAEHRGFGPNGDDETDDDGDDESPDVTPTYGVLGGLR